MPNARRRDNVIDRANVGIDCVEEVELEGLRLEPDGNFQVLFS